MARLLRISLGPLLLTLMPSYNSERKMPKTKTTVRGIDGGPQRLIGDSKTQTSGGFAISLMLRGLQGTVCIAGSKRAESIPRIHNVKGSWNSYVRKQITWLESGTNDFTLRICIRIGQTS